MIHWGVLGYGNIAQRFIKSLDYSDEGKLYAIATASQTQKVKQDYPHVLTYMQYQDLINDPQVDAIYIALRHGDHYQWAKEALLHNKAVLCEKPATLSYQQTKELCDISKQKHTFFMEAMKTRFVPMINEIKKIINQGTLGKIQRIETSFCNDVAYNERSYLFDKKQGGILYDCGVYNIETILDFIHAPILDIQIKYEEKYGVDAYDLIELTFETGQSALIECALDRSKDKTMKIICEQGTITATPFYRPQEAIVQFDNGESLTGTKPYVHDDFYGEIAETHRCIAYILEESPRMTHQDSLDAIELIEKIKEKMHG